MSMKRIIVLVFVSYITSAFACDAITKKGTRCKRASAPGSNYCWQHGGGRGRSSYLSHETTTHTSDTSWKNGDSFGNVPKPPCRNLVVKSFLGVPVGALARRVQGATIKEKPNARLVTVQTFRHFSKATVDFTGENKRVYGITSEYVFPPKVTKESVFKEADAILKILESNSGVKFRKAGGGSGHYSGGSALGRIGGSFGDGCPEWDYEYCEPTFIHIRLTCKRVKVDNKALRGPNTPTELDAWKMVLSFRALNIKETDWHDVFVDGIALP